jgi:hypothetical protein
MKKYALLAALVGIFFITYMAYDFHTSYSIDVVGGWERMFIFVDFVFHLPFLALISAAVILYLKKNMNASLVLGVGSLIYIILHLLVPHFLLQERFSLSFITIFPLLGVIISVISIFECKIYNKNIY